MNCSMPDSSLLHCLLKSLLKLMSLESVMLSISSAAPFSFHLQSFPESQAPHIRWLKCWSFSFSISPSNGYSGLISFRIDLISLQSKGLSRVFFSAIQKHQFFGAVQFHGILQARILEWVAFPFSRFCQPRDQTGISRTEGGFFTSWATWKSYLKIGSLMRYSHDQTFPSYFTHQTFPVMRSKLIIVILSSI